jgi:4-amino-4-deoxy-L-arabinose transferase-like glycosyltransferase
MAESRQDTHRLDRFDLGLALAAGIASLAMYVRTLAPWVLPGDSGEFQVLSYQVGTGHTPGYPVYMLLSKLFLALIPIRDVAFRVNLFSAVMAAFTVAGVYLCIRLLSASRWGGLFGGAALAVSFSFWSQAVIAEVYTPAAAFLVAVWFLILVWHQRGNRWALFAAGVCGGLGLGVHANLVLAVPAVLLLLFLNGRRGREWLAPALLGGILGLALFLGALVAVDARNAPASSFNVIYGPARSAWGYSEEQTQDPLERMKFLLLARQWTGAMFSDPAAEMPAHWKDYVVGLPREFHLGTLILAGIGILGLAVRYRRVAAFFLAGLLVHGLFTFNYSIWDIYVMYIPGYALLAMLAGIGLGEILALAGRIGESRIRALLRPLLALSAAAVFLWPILSPRISAVRAGRVSFIGADRYILQTYGDFDYGMASRVVRALEPDAVVLMGWDHLYQYWYAASIDQQRTDLRFVELQPYHQSPGFPASTIQFIRAQLDAHPVYLAVYSADVEAAGLTLSPVSINTLVFFKVGK